MTWIEDHVELSVILYILVFGALCLSIGGIIQLLVEPY